jgi:DNA polymerase sigma
MLIEILELYGTRFNFDRVGVAIDNGGEYFQKLDYQLGNQKVWKNICIRDPNDPTNNIAKASHQHQNIIKVFYDTFGALTKRCCIVHGKIQKGEEAPWGTRCGSMLDSIIETPRMVVRDRLRRAWKKDMEGIDSSVIQDSEERMLWVEDSVARDVRPRDAPPREAPPREAPSREAPPKRSKRPKPPRSERDLAKRERKAAKRAANLEKRRAKRESEAAPAPAPPPSPTREKTTRTTSSGTRDIPIVLDDSDAPSSPRPPRAAAPTKKRKIKTENSAASNLEATGSITGVSRNAIVLD